jgi:hypothetical protein
MNPTSQNFRRAAISASRDATSRATRGLIWTLRSFAALFAIVAVVALSGATFEAIASSRDATTPPPPGRFVDVGGFRSAGCRTDHKSLRI